MIDPAMIVNCTVYKKGKKLRDISLDEISDVLEEEGTFVWLGFEMRAFTRLRVLVVDPPADRSGGPERR